MTADLEHAHAGAGGDGQDFTGFLVARPSAGAGLLVEAELSGAEAELADRGRHVGGLLGTASKEAACLT
jgi:hypothetical protein